MSENALTPGSAVWNYIRNSVPSQLGAAGYLAQSVAQPFTNLFGNGGQEFWNGPQDPQAAHDMSNALMTMYAGSATPGAAEMSPAALNVGVRLRPRASFEGGGSFYDMLAKDTGEPLGFLGVEPHGDALHVTNIYANAGLSRGRNSIGQDGMRDVLGQLKDLYPEAKTIQGNRVSGARQGGKYMLIPEDEAPLASVKLRSGNDQPPNPLAAGLMAENQPQNAMTGIKAFHGSPYDFDRFDASKIGTGEGAQAYGHGLYFAENEGVAKGYRDRLSGGYNTTVANMNDPEHLAQLYLSHYGHPADAASALKAEITNSKALPSFSKPATPEIGDNAQRYVAGLEGALGRVSKGGVPEPTAGKMYQVNINADPASFLDWDKPIHEQPSSVQKYFAGKEPPPGQEWRGSDLIGGRPPGSGSAIESELSQAGIPGIRYLDQGSRGAGEGSHNYVVFPGNEHLIEIVKKYGIAGAATMLGLSQSDLHSAVFGNDHQPTNALAR